MAPLGPFFRVSFILKQGKPKKMALALLSENELNAVVEKAVVKALSEYTPSPPTIPTTEEWLTVDQLASYIHFKKPTIYGYVSDKRIPHCKMGKILLFRKSEIDQWLMTARQSTKTEIENEVQSLLGRKK